jgi:hypothetical protein
MGMALVPGRLHRRALALNPPHENMSVGFLALVIAAGILEIRKPISTPMNDLLGLKAVLTALRQLSPN